MSVAWVRSQSLAYLRAARNTFVFPGMQHERACGDGNGEGEGGVGGGGRVQKWGWRDMQAAARGRQGEGKVD